jgi:very-short-patch-repair endonuclease
MHLEEPETQAHVLGYPVDFIWHRQRLIVEVVATLTRAVSV